MGCDLWYRALGQLPPETTCHGICRPARFSVRGRGHRTGRGAAGRELARRPEQERPVKEMPYESGMDPIHDTRRRFDVRFHLVAIAFLVFDVELLFLYPWAVASRNPHGHRSRRGRSGWIAEPRPGVRRGDGVHRCCSAAGFVYAWRKGVFRWR